LAPTAVEPCNATRQSGKNGERLCSTRVAVCQISGLWLLTNRAI
jgi:hypothetical protein